MLKQSLLILAISTSLLSMNIYAQEPGQGASQDITRKEHAQALINYESDARLKEFEKAEELMFMKAPATEQTIKAVKDFKQTEPKVGQAKSQYSNQVLRDSLTSKILNDPNLRSAPQAREALSQLLQDPNNVQALNPGLLMNKSEITQQEAASLVGIIGKDSSSALPPALTQMINELGALERPSQAALESLGKTISEEALTAISANALSQIAANRTGPNSLNSIAEQLANLRLTDQAWFEKLGAASDTAILREIAQMEAYRTWLQYQQFKMQEQQMALMAAMNVGFSKLSKVLGSLSLEIDKAQSQAAAAAAEAQKEALDRDFVTDDVNVRP